MAWSLDDAERLAHAVTMGTFDGNKFDWDNGRWLTRDERGED